MNWINRLKIETDWYSRCSRARAQSELGADAAGIPTGRLIDGEPAYLWLSYSRNTFYLANETKTSMLWVGQTVQNIIDTIGYGPRQRYAMSESDQAHQFALCLFSQGPMDGTMLQLPLDIQSVSFAEGLALVAAGNEDTDDLIYIDHLYMYDHVGDTGLSVFLYQGIDH